MSRFNNRMYTENFEPALDIGDVVVLMDIGGPLSNEGSPFYDVVHCEGLPILGNHGEIMLITGGGTVPASIGKSVDGNALTSGLAVGASSGPIAPASLVVNLHQLVQARFKLAVFNIGGTMVMQDIDLQAFQPNAIARWRLQNVVGGVNAMQQVQNPSAIEAVPAQGANQAVNNPFGIQDTWGGATAKTELFWYFNVQPQFQFINNSSVVLPSTAALGIEVSGFQYILSPRPVSTQASGITLAGGLQVPVDVARILDRLIILPISGRTAPQT